MQAQRLGTGHGPRELSYVSLTQFERRSQTPDEVVLIRYDSMENLLAAGIVPANDADDAERFPEFRAVPLRSRSAPRFALVDGSQWRR